MHPAHINAALQVKGTRARRLAEQLGVQPSAVCDVICGRSRSRRIATAISQAIGKPVPQIWPNGEYDRPRKRRQRSTKGRAA
jgi:lambda repressor-like predicted transcriptional regulator